MKKKTLVPCRDNEPNIKHRAAKEVRGTWEFTQCFVLAWVNASIGKVATLESATRTHKVEMMQGDPTPHESCVFFSDQSKFEQWRGDFLPKQKDGCVCLHPEFLPRDKTGACTLFTIGSVLQDNTFLCVFNRPINWCVVSRWEIASLKQLVVAVIRCRLPNFFLSSTIPPSLPPSIRKISI